MGALRVPVSSKSLHGPVVRRTDVDDEPTYGSHKVMRVAYSIQSYSSDNRATSPLSYNL